MRRFLYILPFLLLNGLSMAQRQHVELAGKIHDREGNSVKNAALYFSFNGDSLCTVLSDADGFYQLDTSIYGSIQDVDVLLMANGHFNQSYTVDLYRAKGQRDFEIEKIPERKNTHIIICCGLSLSSYYMNDFRFQTGYTNYASQPGDMFRSPWGTFAYIKPTVVYYPKITQQITVLDEQNQPIRNARVEVKVPDDVPHWGLTDENGKLTLYMQFKLGAHFAVLSMEADGYKHLKRRHLELNVHTQNTFKITKMQYP